MVLRRPDIARGAVTFALLVMLGALPGHGLRFSVSRVLSDISNIALSTASFPGGIQAGLSPLPPDDPVRAGPNIEADARLVLRAPAHGTSATLGLSLRRDVYLPLVIFLAAILALPLAVSEKAVCLGLGVPVVMGVAVASIWLLVARITSELPGAISGDVERALTAFMFERWLTPPGNRVIAPLLFAAVLSVLVHGCARGRAASSTWPPRACRVGPVSSGHR